jgi:hypothetical protein
MAEVRGRPTLTGGLDDWALIQKGRQVMYLPDDQTLELPLGPGGILSSSRRKRLGSAGRAVRLVGALLCLALYVIPRTSVLGAILLTGYLGGATRLDSCAT